MSPTNVSRRLLWVGAIGLLACAALAIAIWSGLASSGSASAATGAAASGLAPPERAVVDGVVQIAPVVQDRIDALNDQLDACLTANGAKRVPFGERGWAYQDPDGAATAACRKHQAAVDTYAASDEMRAAAVAAYPAAHHYHACMEGRGVGVVIHQITPPAAVSAAEALCTAETNAAITALR